MGNTQTVLANEDIIFHESDVVGNAISFIEPGAVFVINQPGLYHIEWSVHLAAGNPDTIIGTLENDEPVSAIACSGSSRNCSSGALIYVDVVPYVIRLRNFENTVSAENYMNFVNTAVSIRIARFADGPSV